MMTLQERLRANVMTHSRAMYTAAADRLDELEREVKELRKLVEMMAAQEGTTVFTTETRRRIDAARSKT